MIFSGGTDDEGGHDMDCELNGCRSLQGLVYRTVERQMEWSRWRVRVRYPALQYCFLFSIYTIKCWYWPVLKSPLRKMINLISFVFAPWISEHCFIKYIGVLLYYMMACSRALKNRKKKLNEAWMQYLSKGICFPFVLLDITQIESTYSLVLKRKHVDKLISIQNKISCLKLKWNQNITAVFRWWCQIHTIASFLFFSWDNFFILKRCKLSVKS